MGLKQDLETWATGKIRSYGAGTITGQVAGEVLDILNGYATDMSTWGDDTCPQCGIPWGQVSPGCPRTIWDRHPGIVHDDGRRYLCRKQRVFTRLR